MKVILDAQKVCKKFRISRGKYLHAVDQVDLQVREGETFGLVGESGCGKSTLGKVLIRLHSLTDGSFSLNGSPIGKALSRADELQYRKDVQMIFQDPYSSLNPRMTVRDIIAEGAMALGIWTQETREAKSIGWLERVGLAADHMDRYPHEFSGGQRQRIGIARALAVEPKLLICDEPISALDVSVQAQVVQLLKELQLENNLTMIFIAHDLSMVRTICDRMAVMYLGQIVEQGTSSEIYDHPKHPYTRALIEANPIPDPVEERSREHKIIKGEVRSPINPHPGCRFANRCSEVMGKCRDTDPVVTEANERLVRCHLY